MVLAIVFAFVAGLITAVSPCVLPVLPIVFAGGVAANRRRPFAIIAGLAFTFLVSILFAAWLLDALGLPKDLLRNVSIGLLFLLAATLIFPQVGVWIERPLSRLSRRPSGDLGGGFLLGCALGFVFVPCGGPAIGFVTVSASAHEFGFKTIAVAVAYTLGLSAVLLAIAVGGRRASNAVRVGVQRFRVAFGIILAASAFALVFDLDTKLQTWLPNWTSFLQDRTEASASGRKAFERTKNVTERTPVRSPAAAGSLPDYGKRTRLRRHRPVAEQQAADDGGAARQGRPDRLLDVLVHQLPADAPSRRGLVPAVPEGRARGRRRPHARVRLRARAVERRGSGRSGSASGIRSRSTTTTGPGPRGGTSTGRRSTSSTEPDTSGPPTSARASTTSPRRTSARSSARSRRRRRRIASAT